MMACDGMCWYVMACDAICQYVVACDGMCQYVVACAAHTNSGVCSAWRGPPRAPAIARG